MSKNRRSWNQRSVLNAVASVPTIFNPAIAVPETVKIGLVGPKTGPLALFYAEMAWAVEHAKKAPNNSITINGTKHPLEIVTKDSQSNPNRFRWRASSRPQRPGTIGAAEE